MSTARRCFTRFVERSRSTAVLRAPAATRRLRSSGCSSGSSSGGCGSSGGSSACAVTPRRALPTNPNARFSYAYGVGLHPYPQLGARESQAIKFHLQPFTIHQARDLLVAEPRSSCGGECWSHTKTAFRGHKYDLCSRCCFSSHFHPEAHLRNPLRITWTCGGMHGRTYVCEITDGCKKSKGAPVWPAFCSTSSAHSPYLGSSLTASHPSTTTAAAHHQQAVFPQHPLQLCDTFQAPGSEMAAYQPAAGYQILCQPAS